MDGITDSLESLQMSDEILSHQAHRGIRITNMDTDQNKSLSTQQDTSKWELIQEHYNLSAVCVPVCLGMCPVCHCI